MNKNCNMCENKKLLIPEHELYTVVEERNAYYSLLSNIIVLFKHEDKLKKHHRPYLHVRAELDKMCDKALKCIEEMGTQRKSLELHATDVSCEKCVCETDAEQTNESLTQEEIDEVLDEMFKDLETFAELLYYSDFYCQGLASGRDMSSAYHGYKMLYEKDIQRLMNRWGREICGNEYEPKSE